MILPQSLLALQVLKKKVGMGERQKSKADLDDTILETMLFGRVSIDNEGVGGVVRIFLKVCCISSNGHTILCYKTENSGNKELEGIFHFKDIIFKF